MFRMNRKGSKVLLNVYDLSPEHNAYLYHWGLGAYHSGVEINGVEYTFGSGGGVFEMTPKNAGPDAIFRESIDMGVYEGSSQEFESILNHLRIDFNGSSYNILTRNCNHFADKFLQLVVKKSAPAYVNRLASLGSAVSCLLPPSMTGAAPVDNQPQTQGGNYRPLRSSGQIPMESRVHTYSSSSGVKLGGASVSESNDQQQPLLSHDEDAQSRRERMRQAALSRSSSTSAGSSSTSNGLQKKD